MVSHQSSEFVRSEVDQKLEHDISIQHQQNYASNIPESEAALLKEPPGNGDKFEPLFQDPSPNTYAGLPPEIWNLVYSAPANFTPHFFLEVSRNLLENPNLTASHLSRAELSYQSFTDASYNPSATHPHELASIIKHLKPDHQPLLVEGGIPDYTLEWTVVRKLIPRNPKLDAPLMQTCHLFTSTSPSAGVTSDGNDNPINNERYLIIYIPHVANPEEIPFYHPKVAGLAILYSYNTDSKSTPGTLSIHYKHFPSKPLDNRLQRTALKMLEIVHKHAKGRAAGYQKRVHHDVIIPQKPFQDTYAYLKGKYAKQLIDNWVEVTPAQKHVFEDLGIASFLIELWTEMYGGEKEEKAPQMPGNPDIESLQLNNEDVEIQSERRRRAQAQDNFPGFVDIGCGNGILVWILNQEGWNGWGFDARRRKSWEVLEPDLGAEKLKEMLLVPEALSVGTDEDVESSDVPAHNGLFPSGTFIVSNHADELTAWTPILGYLSSSPFIAIPCCSHNFGGTRFRAPPFPQYLTSAQFQSNSKNKQPSAYASLCSYVSHITEKMGYKPEKEHLRIPSTRNIAVVGRSRKNSEDGISGEDNMESRMQVTRGVVEGEMQDCTIDQVRLQWLKRGSGLVKEKGGH